MARALRIEYPGAFYHVINRGVERRRIFAVPADHERFLRLCSKLRFRYSVSFYAYCLMPNHYHLFLRTKAPNLHRCMQELNGQYSNYYNRRCVRVGPIFQGRYRAILVESEEYGLGVARYIHRNPVEARLVDRPEDYRWSSYRAYMKKGRGNIVETGFLLGRFKGTKSEKVAAFKSMTLAKEGDSYQPAGGLKGGVIAGGQKFWEWLKREMVPRKHEERISRWGELQEPAEDVKESILRRIRGLTEDVKLRRKLLAYGLKHGTALRLKEIAKITEMRSVYAVSQAVRRLEGERRENAKLARTMRKLDGQLRIGQ